MREGVREGVSEGGRYMGGWTEGGEEERQRGTGVVGIGGRE